MFPELHEATFWLAVVNIIWIDILLSGDNALVIAMACRNLPDKQRKWGIALGALAAVIMRVAFAGIITTVMTFPYLKLIGGILLIWVAVKMVTDDDGTDEEHRGSATLFGAISTIMIADAVMSLDNVIAVAAIARGSVELLIFGLIVSIPLVVTGATLITSVLKRLPVLVWAGAALLGYIAADVMISDPALNIHLAPMEHYGSNILGAGFVVLIAIAVGWLKEYRAAA